MEIRDESCKRGVQNNPMSVSVQSILALKRYIVASGDLKNVRALLCEASGPSRFTKFRGWVFSRLAGWRANWWDDLLDGCTSTIVSPLRGLGLCRYAFYNCDTPSGLIHLLRSIL